MGAIIAHSAASAYRSGFTSLLFKCSNTVPTPLPEPRNRAPTAPACPRPLNSATLPIRCRVPMHTAAAPKTLALPLSSKARRTKEAPISYLIATGLRNPGLINLAAGLVDPLTLPVQECEAITHRIFSDKTRGRAALQ